MKDSRNGMGHTMGTGWDRMRWDEMGGDGGVDAVASGPGTVLPS
jgi:hypothetical protein